jgi:hypothetical protein
LKELRDRNLDEASFEDKLDIIVKLGIKVYPSEDLKTMRVTCGFGFEFVDCGEQEHVVGCRKVMFGSPFWTKGKTKTFEKTFALVY